MKITQVRNAKWNEPEKVTFNCEILTDEYPNEWLPFSYSPVDMVSHVVEFRNGWLAENQNQIQELTQAEYLSVLSIRKAITVRMERDNKLKISDQYVLPDRWAVMTDQSRQEWSQYRQLLRDLTLQPGFPFEVSYPIPPIQQ